MAFSLSMLGVRLVLQMGPVVPLPCPRVALEAIERVEVTADRELGSAFRITFRLTKSLLGEFDLLLRPQLQPMSRVIIGVLIGVVPQVLIDGLIECHQIIPSTTAGQSKLVVTGRDLTSMMDKVELQLAFPGCTVPQILSTIFARYAAYGIVPTFGASVPVPDPKKFPSQTETDLRCLRRLAKSCAAVFYLEPVSFGVNIAYFGENPRPGLPQPALRVERGELTNVLSLSFKHTPSLQKGIAGQVYIPGTSVAVPMPPLPDMTRLPLSLLRDIPTKTKYLPEVSKMSPGEALLAMQAAAGKGAETVRATGTVDTLRYGRVLRCYHLVSVVGAGLSFDGLYEVVSVTHDITREKYTQGFTLAREGRVSTLPLVP